MAMVYNAGPSFGILTTMVVKKNTDLSETYQIVICMVFFDSFDRFVKH